MPEAEWGYPREGSAVDGDLSSTADEQ